MYIKTYLITSLPDYKKDNNKTLYAYIHYIHTYIHTYTHTHTHTHTHTNTHTHIYTVELGYNVMKGNEYSVSL